VSSVAALSSACAPTTAPSTQPTLKIGVLLPYTESSIGVDIGLNQKRAADLYLKQRNGKLGGRAVSLVYSSESIEAAINKVKVQTLTGKENVELLLGAASADTAGVMRTAAEASKLVYIDTNATANALTRASSKYLFRTSASSWQLSEPLGEWLSKNGQLECYLCGVDDAFGSESAEAFIAGLAKNGGKVTAQTALPSGGDFTKIVASIKAQPTKQVFAALYTDDAESFITEWDKQAMREAGYTLHGPGWLTDEKVLSQVKTAATGIQTLYFWSTELDNSENRALVDAFAAEYTDEDSGEPVTLNGYAVQMWDAMTALDAALAQTGGNTTSTDALIAALETVSFASPRGKFVFDKSTHNPVQDVYIREVRMSSTGKPVNAIVGKVPSVTDPGA
jgi:branched-chain amino acid transport system substrate-binding protein